MNGLITEGIPLGIEVQILTSGLSLGDIPPPPEPVASAGLLYLGVTASLVTDETGTFESPFFNLPTTSTRLSIQAIGTITSVTVLLSNNGIDFVELTPISAASILSLRTNARWIGVVSVGTGVTVLVNARREKF